MNVFQPERTTALLSRIIIKFAWGRPEEESKHLSELGFVDVHNNYKMPRTEDCDEDDLIRNEVELRLLCNVAYLQ